MRQLGTKCGRAMAMWIMLKWCILLVLSVQAQAQEAAFHPITSDSAAVVAAGKITGLGDFFAEKGYRLAVNEVVSTIYVDTTTPYIHEQLNGRPAWRVTWSQFEHVIDSVCGVGKRPTPAKICHVWMDSTTGKLLSANIGRVTIDDAQILPLDSITLLSLMQGQCEKYLGLPEGAPKVSMLEALSQCKHHPSYSAITIVQYVTMTHAILDSIPDSTGAMKLQLMTSEPFAAWIVYMPGHGMAPKRASGPMGKATRLVVDAMTGKSYGLTDFEYLLEE